MNLQYEIHGEKYSLKAVKAKLLKLPIDRFGRLKESFVGKNQKMELMWHNAIIRNNDQAMYISDINKHIEDNISKTLWLSL